LFASTPDQKTQPTTLFLFVRSLNFNDSGVLIVGQGTFSTATAPIVVGPVSDRAWIVGVVFSNSTVYDPPVDRLSLDANGKVVSPYSNQPNVLARFDSVVRKKGTKKGKKKKKKKKKKPLSPLVHPELILFCSIDSKIVITISFSKKSKRRTCLRWPM
jgi:hypothetical protein